MLRILETFPRFIHSIGALCVCVFNVWILKTFPRFILSIGALSVCVFNVSSYLSFSSVSKVQLLEFNFFNLLFIESLLQSIKLNCLLNIEVILITKCLTFFVWSKYLWSNFIVSTYCLFYKTHEISTSITKAK